MTFNRIEDPRQTEYKLGMATQLAMSTMYERFSKVARHGQFDAFLPHPKRGVILVGGLRNMSGKIPAQTRLGLLAAFKGAQRAQAAQQAFYALYT